MITAREPWTTWRSLIALFPLWRLPLEAATTPGGRGYLSADFVSGLARNASTAAVLEMVRPLDDGAFERLSCLAQLNMRRHEVTFRLTALIYLALPVSGGITFSQVAPSMMAGAAARAVAPILVVLALFTGWVLFQLAGLWRARQIAAVLEIARIEQDRALPGPRDGAGIGSAGGAD